MKYCEIDKNKVKEICNAMRYKEKGRIFRNCEKCPLRRENENSKTGVCWYILDNIFEEYIKEHNKWQKEEVCHPTELEAWLKETQE